MFFIFSFTCVLVWVKVESGTITEVSVSTTLHRYHSHGRLVIQETLHITAPV